MKTTKCCNPRIGRDALADVRARVERSPRLRARIDRPRTDRWYAGDAIPGDRAQHRPGHGDLRPGTRGSARRDVGAGDAGGDAGTERAQSIPITIGAADFALPGALELIATAPARTDAAVAARAAATVTVDASSGVAAEFEPGVALLPAPGTTRVQVVVRNTGNVEDMYTAAITSVSGPLTVSLVGLDGVAAQEVPFFRVPGLAGGALSLDAGLTAATQGQVTVTVTSLADSARVATAPLLVAVGEATATPVPSATPTPTATPEPPCLQPCTCDCDGDCMVTVSEMIRAVLISLGETTLDQCSAADRNKDGMVTVDELVSGVHNALNGCPS
jgi:hypothetical protein